MPEAPLIAVLFHAREHRAPRVGYKLWKLSEAWRAEGLRVQAHYGLKDAPAADLWINHLDLTHVPAEYARWLARQPVVINRQVLDVSKRAISTNLLAPGDSWPGPVIVKTDLNHGGVPERRALGHPGAGLSPLRALRRTLARWLPRRAPIVRELRRHGCVDPAAYPTLPSLAHVPQAVWHEPGLVVERFLPERDGELYCGRCYLFLGDRSLSLRKWGTAPVLRARSVTRMEPIPDCPEMVAMRRRLGFDFGKFDYVVHGDSAVLLDASRTPTFAFRDAPLTDFDREMIETLSKGIHSLLAGRLAPADPPPPRP